jgi:hypothetical protein
MSQDPYFYEARGVSFSDYEWLRENADENGYVDPYAAEAHGIPHSSWQTFVEEGG